MATILTKINLTVSAVILLCIVGCSGPTQREFSQFVTLDTDGWVYNDSVRIIADLPDSTAIGTLLIHTCHDDDYVYANLWVEVSYPGNDSARTLCRDTFNLPLANKYGQWLGKGFGTTFQTTDTVAADYILLRGDTLVLRHVMRVDTLGHISQIGLSLGTDNH
ncbi:MAG: gliding motility lipoprotein GldH [Muribaculum sp.]|nr:gliding motility lipoprotein GldH [Muribaculum sp.]